MNLEYVLISYGLWVLAFVIYIPWIKQKRKVFRQSLKTLKETQRQKRRLVKSSKLEVQLSLVF